MDVLDIRLAQDELWSCSLVGCSLCVMTPSLTRSQRSVAQTVTCALMLHLLQIYVTNYSQQLATSEDDSRLPLAGARAALSCRRPFSWSRCTSITPSYHSCVR